MGGEADFFKEERGLVIADGACLGALRVGAAIALALRVHEYGQTVPCTARYGAAGVDVDAVDASGAPRALGLA